MLFNATNVIVMPIGGNFFKLFFWNRLCEGGELLDRILARYFLNIVYSSLVA
jgi:hypothetical protein